MYSTPEMITGAAEVAFVDVAWLGQQMARSIAQRLIFVGDSNPRYSNASNVNFLAIGNVSH